MIKRALLDPESGAVIPESERRRAQLRQTLDALFERAPSAVGVYLDRRAMDALDRALIDELIAHSAGQHRVIVTPRHHDDTLRSVARAEGVRHLELTSALKDQGDRSLKLGARLKSLEAALVLTGEIALDLDLSTPMRLSTFTQWINQIKQRQVHLFRVSERAW